LKASQTSRFEISNGFASTTGSSWTSPHLVEGFSDRFYESEEQKWVTIAAASDGFSTMPFVENLCGF
jgi:hypothetical protein